MSENPNEPAVQPADPQVEPPVAASPEPLAAPSVESPESAESPESVAPSAPPARKPRNRGRIAAVAACALLAVAVVAGVGYTVVTVDGADRDAGAAVWKFPKPKTPERKQAPVKGLSGLLVAYGDGWKRGPDFGQFAADSELGAAQATALRKESVRDLPRTERKQLEKLIDKEHVKGMAMRSYAKEAGSAFFTDTAVTVNITLSRMESPSVVRRLSNSQNAFFGSVDIFRKGPKIKGHTNAQCFLPPKSLDKHLDAMYCSAYQGNILVHVTASGVKPFDSQGVADLLADQLKRIGDPGEAV
ncbi:hypothetical protein [Streptomyces sp. CdTB01]|uniref:hypothetical protein n=1 Tax=Streptomyces sp. CdTB01 TaxID=1725411 RepID=UPI00073AB6B4|nr:hypothetical protein [Streptomyces sp. CdTB01]ALV34910.1 hypothetical protein AS200_24825 [Streptomyces sp. CdTB01]